MPAPSNQARVLVEEFTLAEIEREGADDIDDSATAKVFMTRGACRKSVYRWMGDVVAGVVVPATSAVKPPLVVGDDPVDLGAKACS